MLIPPLAIYHKKERHGLPKKGRKKCKSSIVQKEEEENKERERERENKVDMLSKRKLEEGKFSNGVPLPPNTTHLHILIILYDLLLLMIPVFDLAIYSIQLSLAFYLPTHKLHISLRVGKRAKIFWPWRGFKHH
jgi:hypothetical protein